MTATATTTTIRAIDRQIAVLKAIDADPTLAESNNPKVAALPRLRAALDGCSTTNTPGKIP